MIVKLAKIQILMNIYFTRGLIVILSLSMGRKHPIVSENKEETIFSPNLCILAKLNY